MPGRCGRPSGSGEGSWSGTLRRGRSTLLQSATRFHGQRVVRVQLVDFATRRRHPVSPQAISVDRGSRRRQPGRAGLGGRGRTARSDRRRRSRRGWRQPVDRKTLRIRSQPCRQRGRRGGGRRFGRATTGYTYESQRDCEGRNEGGSAHRGKLPEPFCDGNAARRASPRPLPLRLLAAAQHPSRLARLSRPAAASTSSVIPPKTKEELVEFYREDIERLQILLDRDLSSWLT
jgi:hypothetical protein